LYDTIAELDPPHARFALGMWIDDADRRRSRLSALVDVSVHQYGEWHIAETPFSRPLNDLVIALMRSRVLPSGAPAAPQSLAFWDRVFDVGGDVGSGAIDSAWLAETLSPGDMFARADRLDEFAFGQRVFADVMEAEWPDAIAAIRGLPRQRMLMLTLERIGIRAPSVYASVARQARAIGSEDSNRAFWNLAELQGSCALVARMARVGTISTGTAEKLVTSLFAVPLADDGRYMGGIARWLEESFIAALPPAESAEEALVSALAGPRDARAPRLVWEGQAYRVDFRAAEQRRLRAVREKQGGYSIDSALDLARVARSLRSESSGGEHIQAAVARLQELARALPPAPARRPSGPFVPGVDPPRAIPEVVARAIDDLGRSTRGHEPRRVARAASLLSEAGDTALAEALLSLVYAVDLGDPNGTALLASNVALRHDFGFGTSDGEARLRKAWALPRQDFLPGIPWHVTGSLLGLDIALAPMALRRINPDAVLEAPRVPSNERDAFAVDLALINPRALKDTDRDAIAAAVARGERRIAAVIEGVESAQSLADDISLDGWRRRRLRWLDEHDRGSIRPMFSLVEVLLAGGGSPAADLDAWGGPALYTSACLCTRLEAPSHWHLLAGRLQAPLMSAIVPDLNLRVAVVLAELKLPASLARAVLTAAVQDFIDEASPTGPHDWLGMARGAQGVARQRIEDYVAAAASLDGPLIPDENSAHPN
jgi:hypothetical protein